ncbi:MAG: ABC transporter permease [Parasporobacterium sp.]|nr:ABC transporter permease [Parasporobacterium sp.]
MSLLNLSLKAIYRKWKRSLLLVLIIVVITVFFFLGWSLKNASVKTQNAGKQAIGASFRLEQNEENRHVRLTKACRKIGDNQEGYADGVHAEQLASGAWLIYTDHLFETLVLSDIQRIAAVPGIAEYNIVTSNTVVHPVNFLRVEDPETDQSKDEGGVSLRGEWNMKLDFEVQKGNVEILQGRMIVPGDINVCVLSRQLAEKNGLQVGNRVSFNSWKEPDSSAEFQAEIIGIYDSKAGIPAYMNGDSYRSENIIFTDLDFPCKAEGHAQDPLYQYATFTVEDVDQYDAVKDRILSLDIQWERYDFLDHTGMSETIADNYKDLQNISRLLLILSFASGLLILCLIFQFWIRGRIREIGVFLALGKRKIQIILQILLEGILIGIIGFFLAFAAAEPACSLLEGLISDYHIQLQEEQKLSDAGMVANSVQEEDARIVGVETEMNESMVILCAISVFGMLAGSILLAVGFVMIRKPKEILAKMI